jgi:hypothetical protein
MIFVSDRHEYLSDADVFDSVGDVKVGDYFEVRYSSRIAKDGRDVKKIFNACRLYDKSPLVSRYEGSLRFSAKGCEAFVGDVYLNAKLADKMRSRGCAEGTLVCGLSMLLPPREGAADSRRLNLRRRKDAISVEILVGESLERYRNGHG